MDARQREQLDVGYTFDWNELAKLIDDYEAKSNLITLSPIETRLDKSVRPIHILDCGPLDIYHYADRKINFCFSASIYNDTCRVIETKPIVFNDKDVYSLENLLRSYFRKKVTCANASSQFQIRFKIDGPNVRNIGERFLHDKYYTNYVVPDRVLLTLTGRDFYCPEFEDETPFYFDYKYFNKHSDCPGDKTVDEGRWLGLLLAFNHTEREWVLCSARKNSYKCELHSQSLDSYTRDYNDALYQARLKLRR